jgi:hypothetical protein
MFCHELIGLKYFGKERVQLTPKFLKDLVDVNEV